MPLAWALNRVGADGVVIFAQDAGAGWVETHVFSVASIDRDTLLVQWWRVVNNVEMDPAATSSKWAVGGHGEFTRIGRR